MDSEEALDVVPKIDDIINELKEAKDGLEVSTILVDAEHVFRTMHPQEKLVTLVYLLGRLVDKESND